MYYEYHQGDAINVSTIRYHLLLKFIIKQKMLEISLEMVIVLIHRVVII